MVKRLTPNTIHNIKPGPVRREIPDGGGLYLIVQPSGSKVWALRYRLAGRPMKLTLGGLYLGDVKDAPEPKIDGLLTLAGARKLATAERHKIDEKAHDPAAAKAQAKMEADRKMATTLRSVAESYMKLECGAKFDDDGTLLKVDTSKLRTARERWMMLERSAFPTLGGMPITDIKKSDLVKMLDKLATGELRDQHKKPIKGGKVAADRLLSVLQKIFSWHAAREDDFRSPVVAGLKRVKGKDQARARVLTDEELQTIHKVASGLQGAFPAALLFAIYTGARRGEVAGMRWSEIDAASWDWELPPERNKVKVPLLRPLSKAAQAVLKAQPRLEKQEFVFSSDGRTHISGFSKHKAKFDKALLVEWKKLHPEADAFPHFTIHDARRSVRTWLARLKVSREVAEQMLGHALPGVEGVYNRWAYREEKAQAYELLAQFIDQVANPAPSNVVKFKTGGE
jgi:integrase